MVDEEEIINILLDYSNIIQTLLVCLRLAIDLYQMEKDKQRSERMFGLPSCFQAKHKHDKKNVS